MDLENGLFENIREKRGRRVEVVFDENVQTILKNGLR